MYIELEILDLIVHLINGVISFKYTEKFLSRNFDDRYKTLIKWSIIYAAGQIFLSKITESWSPLDRFINIFPYIIILFALQKLFFEKNPAKQIFIIASFVAGWEILRFTVSPLSHAIFSVWSPFWAWSVNYLIENNFATSDEIISVMLAVNRAIIFFVIGFCRAVQIWLLIFYLRTISEFIRQDYDLKIRDSLFLIFPCLVVIFIDLTVRLMAFSADNGAVMLIYDRVPATVLLLPIVSIFLLGMIISSVILFRHLVEHKDEEHKRILLENRVVEVHREIEELSEIYSEIRGLRHDLRNHIANLAAYFRKNKTSAEVENYLQSMNETVEKLHFTDKTGNAITDIILHRIRQQAKKKNIKFVAEFNCPKKFDVYDLSVILNNALENSIEATEKIRGGKIFLKSYKRGGLFFIEVENNFDGEIKNNFETTKSDKNLHGIGLENIKRCAKKYLGEIDIKITESDGEKFFNLTIMLYNKENLKIN